MGPVRATMGANGRLVIPAEVRRVLNLGPGAVVILVPAGAELRLIPTAQVVRNAQAIVRRHVRSGRSLTRELRAERRRETAHE